MQGDKTTCGGKIIDGASDHEMFGKSVARERDRVTCGKHSGIYIIAGGMANDSIHGRKMAGTLDSISSSLCRARFVASMMDDTYEKMNVGQDSSLSFDNLRASPLDPNNNIQHKEERANLCFHTDGAIEVAEYIVTEIKTNVKSRTAETIRYYIDDETLKQRQAEWEKLPFYAKMTPPPQPDLLTAMAVWYQKVKTGSDWDHKPEIRDKFSSVAVARPLPRQGKPSKSYYHRYKKYDYFYDVWSNIHYGYVGRSVGFTETLLLQGSTWEQNMTPGAIGNDTIDDVTSMKIGFELFRLHGETADSLTSKNILDALENTSDQQLPNSRESH